VKTLFENAVFYFRAGLASHPMFNLGSDTSIPWGMPTVANLGVSFAQQIGFRTIYLFGVDLGSRDPRKHHAKDAPYNAGEIEFTTTIDRPVAGNFGGIVYSEYIYLWSRDIIQALIRDHVPRFVHYNCSDGVRIEGATPKLSRTITLPVPAQNKQTVVEKILTGMPEYARESFDAAWTNKNLIRSLYSLRDTLLGHCRSTSGRGFSLRYIDKAVRELIPLNDRLTPEIHYYRGTMLMTMIALHYYSARVPDPVKRRAVLKIMKEEYARLIDRVAERVVAFYREIDPEKTARDEKEARRRSAFQSKSKPKKEAMTKKKGRVSTVHRKRSQVGQAKRSKRRKIQALPHPKNRTRGLSSRRTRR
jgi:hypothetical protein